ncbi:hypothetical protein [Lacimonas salitolerans]|uniref:Phage shock protein C (PspC) family protein n=1 Tax=Lacimonas salitolerans TaxID=1323750 RepID=A0ABW4EDM2_9RHOB
MTEQERQQQVYDNAMASLRRSEAVESGFAGGLMGLALGMKDINKLESLGDWARTFCVLFAMALPPYFVWALLLR